MFNDGQKIQLFANKVNPVNMWISPFEIQKDEIANPKGFDFIIDRFELFNCSYETGYYTSFYVEVEIKR